MAVETHVCCVVVVDTTIFDVKIPAIAEYAACSQTHARLSRRLCEMASREAPCLFNLFHSEQNVFDGLSCFDFHSCTLPYAGDIYSGKQAVGKVYTSAFEQRIEDLIEHMDAGLRAWSEEAYFDLLNAMKTEIQNVRYIFESQCIPCRCLAFFDELENVGIID